MSTRIITQLTFAGGLVAALVVGLHLSRQQAETEALEKAHVTALDAPLAAQLSSPIVAAEKQRVDEACRPNADVCTCLKVQVQIALDLDDVGAAKKALDRGISCDAAGDFQALRAEIEARLGHVDQATKLATQKLEHEPTNPFALYALGHVAFFRGDDALATRYLREAIQNGRGIVPHELLTLLFFRSGDLRAARAECGEILRARPNHINSLYNLALIEQREDHYHAAREGYLRLLKLEPSHADSRYNLAILTHAAGAQSEAEHNLQKLRSLVGPNDERVRALEVRLAQRGP